MFIKISSNVFAPILAVIVLLPSLQIGAITDDYRNTETAQVLSLKSIYGDLRTGSSSGPHYRPMEPLSFRIENAINYPWEKNVKVFWGYHLTNIIAHALCAWLVFQIALSIFGSRKTAVVAGILFAIHPAAAMASAWISGRTTGFVCLFLLFSTWLYIKSQDSGKLSPLLFSLGAFGAALLTKEQAYLFPVFLFVFMLAQAKTNPLLLNGWPSSKMIRLSSYPVLLIGLSLFGTSMLGWGYGYYLATYGFTLAALAISIWIIGFTARFRPNVKLLILYLLVEAVIVFFGFIPSEVLLKETYIQSPFSFSPIRLSTDIFIILSALGVDNFAVRDVLQLYAFSHAWLIVSLWLTIGGLMFAIFIPKDNRLKVLAGLVWLLIAIAPLRGLPANFFTMANLYLAIPVIAIGIAFVLMKVAHRLSFLSISIGIAIVIYWSTSQWAAQEDLKKMGRFNNALHALLKQDSKDSPGPLRVVINVPDPFRIAKDSSLAHFLVFRVVQSALKLGGYSEKNVSFVEGRILQIVAVDYGDPCNYEAHILDNETILMSAGTETTNLSQCKSQLRPVDFNIYMNANRSGIIASRETIYSGYPLNDAEEYAFDGRTLRLVSN